MCENGGRCKIKKPLCENGVRCKIKKPPHEGNRTIAHRKTPQKKQLQKQNFYDKINSPDIKGLRPA